MIDYKSGDLLQSDCRLLVNTVNCVGVMGKGIALQFKQEYPGMFLTYKHVCGSNLRNGGDLWLWKNPDTQLLIDSNRLPHDVLCFATKEDWRNPSKLEWIERGLVKFRELVKSDRSIYSVAFPKLGCSNGGLDWVDVQKLMEKYLGPLEIKCEIWL